MNSWLFLLLLLTSVAACRMGGEAPDPWASGGGEAEAVARTLRAVERQINAGRLLEAVERYWAEDVVQMSAEDRPRVTPKDSLLARYAAALDTVAFGWRVHSIDDVYVSGDLAAARVRADWRVTPLGGGPPTVYRQELFYLLRRSVDPAWRLLMEAWSDLAVEDAPGSKAPG